MSPDGTGLRHLATPVVPYALQPAYSEPAFSPDGRRIVFLSADPNYDKPEIYVMRADGSKQHRLTHNAAYDHDPAFSPDNTHIVFGRYPRIGPPPGESGIFLMRADGTHQRRLSPPQVMGDSGPTFFPGGERIAFFHDERLATMRVDGSHRKILTGRGGGGNPDVSPDGMQIVYSGGGAIRVINSDGTHLRTLRAHGNDPVYSPDGKRIAYTTHTAPGVRALGVMRADGSHQHTIALPPPTSFSNVVLGEWTWGPRP